MDEQEAFDCLELDVLEGRSEVGAYVKSRTYNPMCNVFDFHVPLRTLRFSAIIPP